MRLQGTDSVKEQQKKNLVKVTEDVKKLQKVCDKVGFYFDDSGPLQCFIIRMALDTSFFDKYQLKAVWRSWPSPYSFSHRSPQLGIVPKKSIIVQAPAL